MYKVEILYVEDKTSTYHKTKLPYIPTKGSCISFSEKTLIKFCKKMIKNGAKGNADELEIEDIGYLCDAHWVQFVQFFPDRDIILINLGYGS